MWTPEWIFGMLAAYPSYIDLVRELGKSFVEVEALITKSGRRSRLLTLYPNSIAESLMVVRKSGPPLPILKVRTAISNWLKDFSYRGWETSYLINEKPIDISAIILLLGDGLTRFVSDCLAPISRLLVARGALVEILCQRLGEFWCLLPSEVKVTIKGEPEVTKFLPIVESDPAQEYRSPPKNIFMDTRPANWYASLSHWNPIIWYRGESYTTADFLYGSCPPPCALVLGKELIPYILGGIIEYTDAVISALSVIKPLPKEEILAALDEYGLEAYIESVLAICP